MMDLRRRQLSRTVVATLCGFACVGAWSASIRADRDPQNTPAPVTSPSPASSPAAQPSATPAGQPPQNDQALIKQYCQTCHNERLKTGGLSLEGMNPADTAAHADVWEKVVLKLRGGMMPPQGMPRPDQPTLERFAVSLEQSLNCAAPASPDPGHKPVHRLNRTEYGNAIRDLLDLEVDVADLLPADDESHGF